MNEQFILILLAITVSIFLSMTISTVLFCKRVENNWKRLNETKEVEITNI
jgi:hypothetical protein